MSARAYAAKSVQPAALLIPRTGDRAALGRSMERAALLAQGIEKNSLLVFDTQGTPAGAAAAARQAMRRRASIVLGPLLSTEVGPVLAVVEGKVPVLTFSNDASLVESGAFLLGITAQQSVSAILRYARGRGIRQVAMSFASSGWGAQALLAARSVAAATGLTLSVLPEGVSVLAAGEPQDALLVATGAPLMAAAKAVRGTQVQLLGAFDGLSYAADALTELDGAWVSAPDPSVFEEFNHAFEARTGTPPGIIAGLAYDAASIVASLRRAGGVDRSGLLTSGGFKGVTGTVRFRENGSAARDLAILTIRDRAYQVIAHSGLV